jgi:hypothetical protein
MSVVKNAAYICLQTSEYIGVKSPKQLSVVQ